MDNLIMYNFILERLAKAKYLLEEAIYKIDTIIKNMFVLNWISVFDSVTFCSQIMLVEE